MLRNGFCTHPGYLPFAETNLFVYFPRTSRTGQMFAPFLCGGESGIGMLDRSDGLSASAQQAGGGLHAKHSPQHPGASASALPLSRGHAESISWARCRFSEVTTVWVG